jgi:cytidylate kinase
MDGRDIGTVVLPDAELKIYLTADVRTRAMRRYQELLEKQGENGAAPVLEMIEQDIRERDERDMNRANSPLRQAPDAIVVDSSDMTPDEVTERILALAAEKSAEKTQQ